MVLVEVRIVLGMPFPSLRAHTARVRKNSVVRIVLHRLRQTMPNNLAWKLDTRDTRPSP